MSTWLLIAWTGLQGVVLQEFGDYDACDRARAALLSQGEHTCIAG